MKKNINKQGFTLIEIIAVIIIIGILALITVPAVSRYVNDSRNKTYKAYEENMEVATNNMITECVSANDKECKIPEKNGKTIYYLSELIDEGYLDELKDPESNDSNQFCDSATSYVEVKNTGETTSDYRYNACLYCSNYETEDETCLKAQFDENAPICGETTGESESWTNKDRTVTVKCSDQDSGCEREEFTKTFRETTKKGNVVIYDRTRNYAECEVNVYVDKNKPTCKLNIIGTKDEALGWYTGEVKVQLVEPKDGENESGLLTYGLGTSINNKVYDKETTITLKPGLTTVVGYVKDYAGNEGICTLDVKVGTANPDFNIEYGYQIYPNKESYTLQNATKSGTVVTSTTTDPRILFTGLSKYKNVTSVVVHLNSEITQTNEKAEVYNSSGTKLGTIVLPTGATKFKIDIPEGSYDGLRIDLGETTGITFDISKIELMINKANPSGLYTNKSVSVNLKPINEVVKTTKYSFDNKNTWQNSNSALYSKNSSGTAYTKNILEMISIGKTFDISNIDKTNPTLTLTGADKYSNTETKITITTNDKGGSGLSSENKYQYCLSSSNKEVKDCTWTNYISGQEFSVTGNSVKYLWVYPVEDNAGNVNDSKKAKTPYMLKELIFCSTTPVYNYTGDDELITDEDGNWKIRFLTSGTLTFEQALCSTADAFLVGGGGGGAGYKGNYSSTGGSGGGGGYTLTERELVIEAGKEYKIIIGKGGTAGKSSGNTAGGDGTATEAFGFTAEGGKGGAHNGGKGGDGGSGGGAGGQGTGHNGGKGGNDGNNGIRDGQKYIHYGLGQLSTTREFGEETGAYYAGGGGGGGGTVSSAGAASKGGGGAGGSGGGPGIDGESGSPGAENTGGGGGGGGGGETWYTDSGAEHHNDGGSGGAGGSGIVILRNTPVPDKFYTYTGFSKYIDEGNGNWQIEIYTSGEFKFIEPINTNIDIFLVGGGGGGAAYKGNYSSTGGSGGGGGYTTTATNQEVTINKTYDLVVGLGGLGGSIRTSSSAGKTGGTTKAFGFTAAGGKGGAHNAGAGGDGGSGGGSRGGGTGHSAGAGGSNGADGKADDHGENYFGEGQGTTTRAFGESTGKLYAGGGGGGGGAAKAPGGNGGSGGGGDGSSGNVEGNDASDGKAGTANTGGGGGGGGGGDVWYTDSGKRHEDDGGAGGNGGSGIIIIRNAR